MKKCENKGTMLLIFLAFFSFSAGLFNNYRVLWLSENGLSTISIGRVVLVANVVTALALLFFSLKVPTKRLKNGVTLAVLFKMITSTLLVCLNGSGMHFLIKFLMFFNIAFGEIVLSSIYPLMLTMQKDDVIYTKREAIESIADKLGLFLVSFLLGRSLGSMIFDYNKSLFASIVFQFLAFMVILRIDVSGASSKTVSLKETLKYLGNNKEFYMYLFLNFIASMTWASILGLKMLTLTSTIGMSSKAASYMVLGFGILTNILALLIVKFLKFKNDYINIFFKYGLRLIFYAAIFITNSKDALLITFIYLLITDITYSFVLGGYFMNSMDERYILLYSVLKYCTSLIGDGIGVFLCGVTFDLEIKYIGLVALILGTITYVLSNILVSKKIKKACSVNINRHSKEAVT